jgi:hypothetical protein
MADDQHTTTTTVEASFADAAQAERAVVQLQEHGVPAERIDVEHGHTSSPGRTAAEDQGTVTRLAGSWWTGVLVGALVGGLIGAIIGAVAGGIGSRIFWALALGCGGGGAGVGALWGMFAGFARRGRGTRSLDDANRPELSDAVRLLVAVDDQQLDSVRRIIREKGGAL